MTCEKPLFLCERAQSGKPSLKEKVTDDCCYNRHLRVGFQVLNFLHSTLLRLGAVLLTLHSSFLKTFHDLLTFHGRAFLCLGWWMYAVFLLLYGVKNAFFPKSLYSFSPLIIFLSIYKDTILLYSYMTIFQILISYLQIYIYLFYVRFMLCSLMASKSTEFLL